MQNIDILGFLIKNQFYLLVGIIGLLILIFIRDMLQEKHAIMRNFPVVGRLRYWIERVGPEIRQYIVANDKEESPFNRAERRWVYASSKGQTNYFGYGTTESLFEVGYHIIKNTTFPFPASKAQYPANDQTAIPCLKVMGEHHQRKKPYRPRSVINISGLSFGALGANAISALNKGAIGADCYHNTGEGGVSPYHLFGGDLILQIGTGYSGVKDNEGNFSMEVLEKLVNDTPKIRAIEIKLSQGAEPGRGGILAAKKVTAEIAKLRKIPPGVTSISPNSHSQFDSVDTLIDFIEEIAERTGLPVGIKSAVGELEFWHDLAQQMKDRSQGPDFIALDGGEGGTGAAPLAFADHVALPFKIGFARVYQIFQKMRLSQKVVWIGSGKLGFPDSAIMAFVMGCDLIQIGREAMMSIGCVQSQNCHTNFCPSGVATQNKWLQRGLVVDKKAERFTQFIRSFRSELLELSHAAGYQHPAQFTGLNIEVNTNGSEYVTMNRILGYQKDQVTFTSMLDYRDV